MKKGRVVEYVGKDAIFIGGLITVTKGALGVVTDDGSTGLVTVRFNIARGVWVDAMGLRDAEDNRLRDVSDTYYVYDEGIHKAVAQPVPVMGGGF